MRKKLEALEVQVKKARTRASSAWEVANERYEANPGDQGAYEAARAAQSVYEEVHAAWLQLLSI